MDQFTTQNGITVHLRPMTSEDSPYLVDIFEHLSAQSRYRRFNAVLDLVEVERIWQEAEQITRTIGETSFGFLAFADELERPNVPVGGVRFVKITPIQAEIAITVRDDMQGQGIGTWLLHHLIDEAIAQGIKILIGVVQNDNAAVWALFRKLNYRITHQLEGNSTFVTIYLDQPGGPSSASPQPKVEGYQH